VTQFNQINATNGQAWDAVEAYFQCITECSLEDGACITRCVEDLREGGEDSETQTR